MYENFYNIWKQGQQSSVILEKKAATCIIFFIGRTEAFVRFFSAVWYSLSPLRATAYHRHLYIFLPCSHARILVYEQ